MRGGRALSGDRRRDRRKPEMKGHLRPSLAGTERSWPKTGRTSIYCNDKPPKDEPESIAASSYDMATEPSGAGRARPAWTGTKRWPSRNESSAGKLLG